MRKTSVPPCVSHFVWEDSRECFLTIDNLKKKGKILINAHYLCKRDEEVVSISCYGVQTFISYGPWSMSRLKLTGLLQPR